MIEVGLFRPESPIGRMPAPATSSGTVRIVDPLQDPVLVEATRRVPARLGTRFGIRFQVDSPGGRAILPVRIRVLHPPLAAPGAPARTVEEWDMEVNAGIARYAGWFFDQDWELVPGPWTFQVWLEGALLLEARFDVERVTD